MSDTHPVLVLLLRFAAVFVLLPGITACSPGGGDKGAAPTPKPPSMEIPAEIPGAGGGSSGIMPGSMPAAGAPALPAGHPPIDGLSASTATPAEAAVPDAQGRYHFSSGSLVIPPPWKSQPPANSMRAAEFLLPDPNPAGKGAVATVFHFGPNQGGTVQSNIDRWLGQVQVPGGKPASEVATIARSTVGGAEVTTLKVSGTISPQMNAAPAEGQRMLALIASTPQGLLVLKAVGDEAAIKSHEAEFDAVAASVASK